MSEDLYLEQLKLGPMENFVYIIGSKSTREVALIDPAWEIDRLLQHLKQEDLKLSSILVTHYHPDHIGGGDWTTYFEIIKNFSKTSNVDFSIVRPSFLH